MTIDISHNARLTALIGRIEELRRRQDAPGRRVASLYLEVGQYVHWLMRQDSDALARIARESALWAQQIDAEAADLTRLGADDLEPIRLDELPIPAVEGHDGHDATAESSRASVRIERSDAGRAISRTEADLPMADVEPITLTGDALGEVADVDVEPVTDGDEVTDSVVASAQGDQAWTVSLRDLLDVLGGPDVGDLDEAACQRSANRLLNATTQMEVRWIGFPDDVQLALVGYIASRSRGLQQRMAIDVELRMALGRLKRFHGARKLPAVPALGDGGAPAGGSWEADQQTWWTELRRGR